MNESALETESMALPELEPNANFAIQVSKATRDVFERMFAGEAVDLDRAKSLRKIVNAFDGAHAASIRARERAVVNTPALKDSSSQKGVWKNPDWLAMDTLPGLGGKRDVRIMSRRKLGEGWLTVICWHEFGFIKRESLVWIGDPGERWVWPSKELTPHPETCPVCENDGEVNCKQHGRRGDSPANIKPG